MADASETFRPDDAVLRDAADSRRLLITEAMDLEALEKAGLPEAVIEDLFPYVTALQPELLGVVRGRAQEVRASLQAPRISLDEAIAWGLPELIEPPRFSKLWQIPPVETLGMKLDANDNSIERWKGRKQRFLDRMEEVNAQGQHPSIPGMSFRRVRTPEQIEECAQVFDAIISQRDEFASRILIGLAAQPTIIEQDLKLLRWHVSDEDRDVPKTSRSQ